jgi:hypothetical protein
VPFFLAGGLKILYDLLLYKEFISIPPVEERVNYQTNMGVQLAHFRRSISGLNGAESAVRLKINSRMLYLELPGNSASGNVRIND